MKKKQRVVLGKGLSALLESKELSNTSSKQNKKQILEVGIERIIVNPNQPRTQFDTDTLKELSDSIKIRGILQPLVVRSSNRENEFELIAGERRLRAAKLAGLHTVPVYFYKLQDQDRLEVALIENIQRDNLNPIEEAKAYQTLINKYDYTQENLAKRIGKNRTTIANLMRLLHLSKNIQEEVIQGVLSTGHARALLSVKTQELQEELSQKVIRQKLSVRETENLVKKEQKPTIKKEIKTNHISPQMLTNQNQLCEKFGTKVTLSPKGDKGKIIFEYYSNDDFNRLFALMSQNHFNN